MTPRGAGRRVGGIQLSGGMGHWGCPPALPHPALPSNPRGSLNTSSLLPRLPRASAPLAGGDASGCVRFFFFFFPRGRAGPPRRAADTGTRPPGHRPGQSDRQTRPDRRAKTQGTQQTTDIKPEVGVAHISGCRAFTRLRLSRVFDFRGSPKSENMTEKRGLLASTPSRFSSEAHHPLGSPSHPRCSARACRRHDHLTWRSYSPSHQPTRRVRATHHAHRCHRL
jgi:hypothetical protein